MNFEHKCTLPNHNNDPLLLICYDEKCSNKGLICLNCLQNDHSGHRAIMFKKFLENHKSFVHSNMSLLNSVNIPTNIFSNNLGHINQIQTEFLKKCKEIFSAIDESYSHLIDFMATKQKYFLTTETNNTKPNLLKEFETLIKARNVQEFNEKLRFLMKFVNLDIQEFTFKDYSSSLANEMHEYLDKISNYQKIFSSEIPLLQKRLIHLLNFEEFQKNQGVWMQKLSLLTPKKDNSCNTSLNKIQSKQKENIKTSKKKIPQKNKERTIERKLRIRNKSFCYTGISGDPKYMNQLEVFCCFCSESSRNSERIKQLGYFFGPYIYLDKDKHKVISYCHELCALWTCGIIMDNRNSISRSFEKELKRTKALSCAICHEKGAGVGCQVKSCKFNAHFKCLIEHEEISLDLENFRVFCDSHGDKFEKKESESESESESEDNHENEEELENEDEILIKEFSNEEEEEEIIEDNLREGSKKIKKNFEGKENLRETDFLKIKVDSEVKFKRLKKFSEMQKTNENESEKKNISKTFPFNLI